MRMPPNAYLSSMRHKSSECDLSPDLRELCDQVMPECTTGDSSGEKKLILLRAKSGVALSLRRNVVSRGYGHETRCAVYVAFVRSFLPCAGKATSLPPPSSLFGSYVTPCREICGARHHTCVPCRRHLRNGACVCGEGGARSSYSDGPVRRHQRSR